MKYLIKKLCTLIITLFILSLLAFSAFSIIGDPAASMLGTNATPEQVAQLRHDLGFDRPLLVQYGDWLSGFLRGDMGTSYSYSLPVSGMVLEKLPTGILLTCLFGLVFRLFTPGAFVSYAENPWGFLGYLFFPALSIAAPRTAMTVKLLRSSILEQLGQDYIRTAYSRGSSRTMALWGHALRNALIPVVTFTAVSVEQVFSVPGIGRLLLASISSRDFPVVQAIVVILALWVAAVNLLADVLYQYADPRIRLS